MARTCVTINYISILSQTFNHELMQIVSTQIWSLTSLSLSSTSSLPLLFIKLSIFRQPLPLYLYLFSIFSSSTSPFISLFIINLPLPLYLINLSLLIINVPPFLFSSMTHRRVGASPHFLFIYAAGQLYTYICTRQLHDIAYICLNRVTVMSRNSNTVP